MVHYFDILISTNLNGHANLHSTPSCADDSPHIGSSNARRSKHSKKPFLTSEYTSCHSMTPSKVSVVTFLMSTSNPTPSSCVSHHRVCPMFIPSSHLILQCLKLPRV